MRDTYVRKKRARFLQTSPGAGLEVKRQTGIVQSGQIAQKAPALRDIAEYSGDKAGSTFIAT
jgi:hypothetical protein